ncbi:hypothetical protein DSECCO2_615870 [anaerobic digester metagenome]
MYLRKRERKRRGGQPPSPVHMRTGMPSSSFKYVTPMTRPSHMLGESAPKDMEPIMSG